MRRSAGVVPVPLHACWRVSRLSSSERASCCGSARGGELQLELRRGRADLPADPVVVRDDLLVARIAREARALELVLLEAAGRQGARRLDGVGLPDGLLAGVDLRAGRALVGEEPGEAGVLAGQAGVVLVGLGDRVEVGVGRADHAAVVAGLAVGEVPVGDLAGLVQREADEQGADPDPEQDLAEPAQAPHEPFEHPYDRLPHTSYLQIKSCTSLYL